MLSFLRGTICPVTVKPALFFAQFMCQLLVYVFNKLTNVHETDCLLSDSTKTWGQKAHSCVAIVPTYSAVLTVPDKAPF